MTNNADADFRVFILIAPIAVYTDPTETGFLTSHAAFGKVAVITDKL
jgi:hypothetical protein